MLLTKRWGRPAPLLAFTGWQLVAGGLVLAVPALVLEGPPPALTTANLLGYAWLAIPGTALAYLAWFSGILRLPASRVSLLSFLTPLTAGALGWAVLGQALAPLQLAGGALILVAVGVGAYAGRPPHRPATAAPEPRVLVGARV